MKRQQKVGAWLWDTEFSHRRPRRGICYSPPGLAWCFHPSHTYEQNTELSEDLYLRFYLVLKKRWKFESMVFMYQNSDVETSLRYAKCHIFILLKVDFTVQRTHVTDLEVWAHHGKHTSLTWRFTLPSACKWSRKGDLTSLSSFICSRTTLSTKSGVWNMNFRYFSITTYFLSQILI